MIVSGIGQAARHAGTTAIFVAPLPWHAFIHFMADPAVIENSVPWNVFLTSHPPDKRRTVVDMAVGMLGSDAYGLMQSPELILPCESEKCSGERAFQSSSGKQFSRGHWNTAFLTYRCRNCNETEKVYAVLFCWEGAPSHKMQAIKMGEWPPLGPSTPRRLRQLLGEDRGLFESGQRAEGQGMGIGAFAYYRRVVENRRTCLFDKLIEAAQRLQVPSETIEALRDDRTNWQFSKSVEGLKTILPDSLKIQGHSPFALLHAALSHNLHNESDEACLEAAQDIRVVLTSFAEQLANLLSERIELERAVGRLTRPYSPSAP